MPFEDATVDTIAEAIEARPSLAPFQLPGASVYQFTLAGSEGRPSAMVTLWPSLRRVDAIGSGAAVVFTGLPPCNWLTASKCYSGVKPASTWSLPKVAASWCGREIGQARSGARDDPGRKSASAVTV